MNKRLFKYMICLMFVFTQVQMFANLNKNDNPWSNSFTSSVIDIYDYLPASFKSNVSILNEDLAGEGVFFALDAEVVDGICYRENTNSKYIKYTLKNISTRIISLNTNDNFRLQLSGEGLNFQDIKYENGTNVNLSTYKYISDNLIINPNGSIVFKIKVGSNTGANFTPSLKIVYGTAATFGTVSITDRGTIQVMDIANNIFNSNITSSLPTLSSGILNPYGSNTLQNSLGLTNQELELLKFYKDDVQISPQTIITEENTSNIKYSLPCLNDNIRGEIRFAVLDYSELPKPGTIEVNNSNVCFGGTTNINSTSNGQGSFLTPLRIGTYALKYSWEVSYDNGVTWQAPTDVSGADSEGSKTATISDVTADFLIRRKAQDRPTNLRKIYYAYSNVIAISVVKNNIIFPNNTNTFAINEGTDFNFPNITTSLPSNIDVYDSNGVVVYRKQGNVVERNTTLTNLPKGTYSYTVKATTITGANAVGCETFSSISLTVYDIEDCNKLKVKTFATHSKGWTSGLSGVANAENAVNGDRSQYATLTGGVVLLGIGTVGIDLYFTKPDPANSNQRVMVSAEDMVGKKVTVKLGEQYSGLKLAGGMSVRAINTSRPITDLSAAPSLVGATYGVKGGVLDLLKGDNVFEFSFVPARTSGQLIPFNGIRIQLGSLLGVADLGTVFHAYIEDEITVDPQNNTCNTLPVQVTPANSLAYPTQQKGITVSNNPITLNKFVDDVTWGNYTEVLNVASGLSSVVYPYYAVDDNLDSYAIFNTTAGVLNKQFLNVNLRQLARPGDQIQITLGTEQVNVLNLGLLSLSAYKIKYFLGDTQVGEQQLDRFRVLDLGLLNFSNDKKIVISSPISTPFDRVQLEQWNTVNVNLGNQLYVFDMRVNPQMLFEGQNDTKDVTTLCAADSLGIKKMDPCTSFEVSFAYVTEYGEQLIDENGNLMTDSQGRPILSIKEIEEISGSELEFDYSSGVVDYFKIERLYPEYGNNLLVKIQTKRQGCDYGDPQYLRVNLVNCDSAIVNPVIKSTGVYR